MKTPSIESSLSRKVQETKSYPIAKRLHDLPLVGHYARRWVRFMSGAAATTRWASLPPLGTA